MRLCLALVFFGILIRPAAAQPSRVGTSTTTNRASAKRAAQKQPRQELKDLVAHRLRQATGQQVRIARLAYNVFTSTFIGNEIEIGSKGRTAVRVPRLEVEMVLLPQEPVTTVARVIAHKPDVRLPASLLERPFRHPIYRPVVVRVGRFDQGRIALFGNKGMMLRFEDVTLVVEELRLSATPAGKAPRMHGRLELRASRLRVGPEYVVEHLLIKGRLDGERLILQHFTVRLPGEGRVSVTGTIGLGGTRGLGPVNLAGEVQADWGKAQIELTGRTLERVQLSGRFSGSSPRRSGLAGAPELRLRLRSGKKRLQGTLRSWTFR